MKQEAVDIVRDAEVMGGEPRLSGTRVTVLQVVDCVEGRGLSAEEVADMYDVAVADVYRALTYYHDNPDVMRDVERGRKEKEDEARRGDGTAKLSDLRVR